MLESTVQYMSGCATLNGSFLALSNKQSKVFLESPCQLSPQYDITIGDFVESLFFIAILIKCIHKSLIAAYDLGGMVGAMLVRLPAMHLYLRDSDVDGLRVAENGDSIHQILQIVD
ncbi:hypothetical protein IW262DRAFT_1298007 [Armillaria fumosa]|nr:hypothetical protein IW262DRAFT_1298007 [Armillaria fumosa]